MQPSFTRAGTTHHPRLPLSPFSQYTQTQEALCHTHTHASAASTSLHWRHGRFVSSWHIEVKYKLLFAILGGDGGGGVEEEEEGEEEEEEEIGLCV